MGLWVAPHKTEAVFMHDGSCGAPPVAHIIVEGTRVLVGDQIKYLGLHIDGTWSFTEHFARMAPKVNGIAAALRRLLPNIGGPGGHTRRLYTATVHAVALYGAPVWAESVMAIRRNKQLMRQVQRRMAIAVTRAYRTVAYEAVLILAGIPPFELLAQMYAEVYQRTRRLREGGTIIIDRIRVLIRKQARQAFIIKWQRRLYDENLAGQRVVGAIRPLLSEWLEVQKMRGTFHTTQVLSGHGCFGDYLCRIGKKETTRCHHCDGDCDSAQHTTTLSCLDGAAPSPSSRYWQ
ncbi:uncharacterized protein LOC115237640 [Formica exsecta]|uniref:uncharacterized protein LOC115237640 n=1 Tax=Formica exsecta TaxID=72781 RepID=UPI001143FDCA|nr:uncharacterized protein LOC115237640 [Formica exsecta]